MLAVRIGTNTRYLQVHEMIMTLTPASNRNIKKIWSVIDSFLKKNEILRPDFSEHQLLKIETSRHW